MILARYVIQHNFTYRPRSNVTLFCNRRKRGVQPISLGHWWCVGWIFLAMEEIFLYFWYGVQVVDCNQAVAVLQRF